MTLNTLYTIQMASTISGVGVHTIRAWEKRYKALGPTRDALGHRAYSRTDVEKLMLLSELCLLGYTISKVAQMPIPQLKELLVDLGKSKESIESPEFNLVKAKAPIDSTQSLGILLFALRAYKYDVIHQEIGKIKGQISARDMALTIFCPLMKEAQKLISSGELSLERSELLSDLLHFHAASFLYRGDVQNERTSLNVLVVKASDKSSNNEFVTSAMLCCHYGFQIMTLQSTQSIESLIDAQSFFNTQLVILTGDNVSFMEKCLAKSNDKCEFVIWGPGHVELQKYLSKKVGQVHSINELDEYLIKRSQSL